MQVDEGKINRVFVIRLEDGEQLPDCLEAFAARKSVHAALVLIVGGAKNGRLVVGPRQSTPAPAPMTRRFSGGHEILGVGTIFDGPGGPPACICTPRWAAAEKIWWAAPAWGSMPI